MTEIVAKFHTLAGPARLVERGLLIALTLTGGAWAAQLHHLLPLAFCNEQYLGLFLALGLAPHPALILHGTVAEIGLAVVTASIGVVLLGVGCAGYLFRPLGWGRRAWAIAARGLMAPPMPGLAEAVLDAAGLGLGVLLVAVERAAIPRHLAEKTLLALLAGVTLAAAAPATLLRGVGGLG